MFVKSFISGALGVTNADKLVSYGYNLIYNNMKTLKSFLLGLALLAVCGAAKASDNDDNASTPISAINTYVDAMTRGKLQGLNEVIDKSASFSMLRGKTVLSFNKAEMLNYFKSNRNVEQTCTTNTSIVEKNANVTIAEVDMKYNDFVRKNYITIANTGDGWKITNVYSVVK